MMDLDRERKKKLKKLKKKIRKISWFPAYQSFSELGIRGRRNDDSRYRYLDFSLCRDKIVADYGCNLGQASIKAVQSGAKRVIGMDSQADTIQSACEIRELLELDKVEYFVVDFNEEHYERRIKEIFKDETPDISFFLSVYRTRELKDRDGLFQFILNNTNEIVLFEGHSDRKIDTVEYYLNIFDRFSINPEFLGYSQRDARPFFIIRLNK